MPCNMMDGYDAGQDAMSEARELKKRVAALEEAMCGLSKILGLAGPGATEDGSAALRAWYFDHECRPGHQR